MDPFGNMPHLCENNRTMRPLLLTVLTTALAFNLQAQWSRIDSLAQGGITAMHFLNADTGFTFCDFGTLRKTVDGGQTWDTVSIPTSSMLLDFAFLSDQVGYAVGGAWFPIPDYYPHAVLKTEDGGQTWDSIYTNDIAGTFDAIAAPDDGHLFLIDQTYLIRSDNGGVTQDTVSFFAQSNQACLRVKFTSSTHGHVLACEHVSASMCVYRLYETTDAGDAWNPVFTDTARLFNYNSDFVFFDADHLLVTDTFGVVHYTATGGATWQEIALPDPTAQVWALEKSLPASVYATVYLPGSYMNQVYHSTDQGLTWQVEPLVLDSFDYIADISFGAGGVGYVATAREIYKKVDPTVGMADAQMSQVRLYPNPASDRVYLGLPQDLKADRVELRDLSGRIVGQYAIRPGVNRYLDVACLPGGTYHVLVTAREQTVAHTKLVVVHAN